LKRLLIQLFKFFGYRVVGYHSIYLNKSNKPKIVEFLGVAGKSYYLNQYCTSIGANVTKPNFNLQDLENSTFINPVAISEFLIKLINYNYIKGNFIKRAFQSIEKIIIQEVYKSQTQFWDEGLIKYNIEFVGYLIDHDPEFLKFFLNDYILIITLPPFDVAVMRYELRMKLLNLNEKFADSLRLKYEIYEKLKVFLDRNELNHIFINDLDTKKTNKQISEFLDSFMTN